MLQFGIQRPSDLKLPLLARLDHNDDPRHSREHGSHPVLWMALHLSQDCGALASCTTVGSAASTAADCKTRLV